MCCQSLLATAIPECTPKGEDLGWCAGGRSQVTLAGHCDYVLSLALAVGAPVLASSGLRGQICLWDLHACAQTGQQVCILPRYKYNTSGC